MSKRTYGHTKAGKPIDGKRRPDAGGATCARGAVPV